MQHTTEHSATPPGDFPAVAAYGMQVTRGTQPVLRNVGFTIPRGRIVGLLGPSGCGKTTLLRCVVGVQQPGGGHADRPCPPSGGCQPKGSGHRAG
ncbi:ATP-binding cassette domain-containing protein [Streptomyces sp. NPDC097107]|uniref:ATP-binding cassette domain-containing protein n=1 Tax=Streptomyces sp. NPDC097107 TaxID=3366089 RepID=UPI0037F49E93